MAINFNVRGLILAPQLRHPELKLKIPAEVFCMSWCADFEFRAPQCRARCTTSCTFSTSCGWGWWPSTRCLLLLLLLLLCPASSSSSSALLLRLLLLSPAPLSCLILLLLLLPCLLLLLLLVS